MHFNKGHGHVSDKLSGSHAFRDASRSVFLFATDDETGQRIISQDKNNYAEAGSENIAFVLESIEVPTDDGNITQVGRVLMQGVSDVSVSDIINRNIGGPDDIDDRNAAQSFVLDYLKESEAWEANAKDVLKAGRAVGFSDTDIKHARSRCRNPRVISRKSGFGAVGMGAQ
jgi:putative DNA primase/helicase